MNHQKTCHDILDKNTQCSTFYKIFRDSYMNIAVPTKHFKMIFNRPMTTYFILRSEDDSLLSYIGAVKKYNMLHKVSIDYNHLKKYRQLCSCDGCFPPCMKLAIKNNLINNITWNGFLKDWRDGEYRRIL